MTRAWQTQCGAGVLGWPLLAAALVTLSVVSPASGQPRGDDIQVTILDVGYNSAYRNGTWVPVDVLVENEKIDVSGYLEVRCVAGTGQTQSPVYRVPVESPNHSRKRFRVHCLLRDVLRVEAMVYHHGRRVVEVPSWVNVMPIRPSDSLILILDEISGNYTFLYNVLQNETADRRVYRHELSTEELYQLPGYQTCYSAFDLIVMSEVDPGRVSVRHRELLRDYVQSGGVLVACIGEGAAAYRGSWVEELLGVRIGEMQLIKETDYAPLVFDAEAAAGANTSRQYSFAQLEPALEGVVVRGDELVLATMRRIGSGAAVALAVDGPSKALQDTDGYRTLWRELAALRQARRPLNYPMAAQAVVQQLPWISGVRIQPKAAVMAYLGLYFAVGIVANWLFWNRMKRREMAWVCLVLFSIAFTTYAVTFGTIGRAKNSEINFIDIVEAPLEGETGELHSLAGVLTAGTAEYSGTLSSEYALAHEATSMDTMSVYGRRPSQRFTEFSPFTLIEGSPARVERMRVGASELRVLHIEQQVPLAGGVDGTLVHDDSGIHGELVNRTGIKVMDPLLYYMGAFHSVQRSTDGWRVEVSKALLSTHTDSRLYQMVEQFRNYGNTWYAYNDTNPDNLRSRLILSLVMQPPTGGPPMLDIAAGPFLFGWAEDTVIESIRLDEAIPQRMRQTLLIADVALREESGEGAAIELPVQAGGGYMGQGQARDQWFPLHPGSTNDLYVQLPAGLTAAGDAYGPLTVDVYLNGPSVPLALYLQSTQGGKSREVPGTVSDTTRDGQRMELHQFVILDLDGAGAGYQNTVFLSLQSRDHRTGPVGGRELPVFSVRATMTRQRDFSGGNWEPWPLSKPSS